MEKFQVNDAVRLTEEYFKTEGYFKNCKWVMKREAAIVTGISGTDLTLRRLNTLFSPVAVDCVKLVWRPKLQPGPATLIHDIEIPEDSGWRGSEHILIKGATGTVVQVEYNEFHKYGYYMWKPERQTWIDSDGKEQPLTGDGFVFMMQERHFVDEPKSNREKKVQKLLKRVNAIEGVVARLDRKLNQIICAYPKQPSNNLIIDLDYLSDADIECNVKAAKNVIGD